MKTPNAITPYAGAKRDPRFATLLSEALCPADRPRPTHLFVLCCGALGDLVTMDPPIRTEIAVDTYGLAINLANVLSNEVQAKTLYARLSRTIVSDGVRKAAIKTLQAEKANAIDVTKLTKARAIDLAYLYFVASWQGRSGISGSQSAWSGSAIRWTTTGGSRRARFCGAVEAIPPFHLRLRNVDFTQGCAIKASEKIEDKDCVAISVDPPYKGRTFKYVYDFREADPADKDPWVVKYGDHGRLARALNRFRKARVAIWYYDVPMLDELYPKERWERRYPGVNLKLRQGGTRGTLTKQASPEVLLVRIG